MGRWAGWGQLLLSGSIVLKSLKDAVVNKPVSLASSYKEVEGEVAHDVKNWGLGLGSSVQKYL